jgi:two-component system KDP operon response regulator KdpE
MTTLAPHVIVVEDEKQIRRFVRTALEAEGCQVYEAETGKQGLIEAGTHKPDLIILDLGLPDLDGVNFIHDFRSWSTAPVLILSARTSENDKIVALDAGADDYLTKPFGVGELLARVRALLRRHPVTASNLIRFGNNQINLAERIVTHNHEPVHLTQIEYRLLTQLVSNTSKVLTHRYLLREVWGSAFIESNHYLRIYIGHLRQKLEDNPTQPKHILTETGVGYRFQL